MTVDEAALVLADHEGPRREGRQEDDVSVREPLGGPGGLAPQGMKAMSCPPEGFTANRVKMHGPGWSGWGHELTHDACDWSEGHRYAAEAIKAAWVHGAECAERAGRRTNMTDARLVEALRKYIADHAPVWEETFDDGPGLVVGLPDAALVAAKWIEEHPLAILD